MTTEPSNDLASLRDEITRQRVANAALANRNAILAARVDELELEKKARMAPGLGMPGSSLPATLPDPPGASA